MDTRPCNAGAAPITPRIDGVRESCDIRAYLRLSPVVFTATLAVFFAAINLAKWVPYAWLGLIDGRNMLTSAVLLPFTPLGVWLGLRFVRRVPQAVFYRLFNLGLLLTGCKLLWDALR